MRNSFFALLLLLFSDAAVASAGSNPVDAVLSFRADEGNRYSIAQRVEAAYGVRAAARQNIVVIPKGNGVSEVRWIIKNCNGVVLSWRVDPARGHLEPGSRASAVLSGLRFAGEQVN
jgi:hypothetical protein